MRTVVIETVPGEDESHARARAIDTTRKLSKDTFSFLVCARVGGAPFFWALTVFAFQIMILSLVAIYIIDLKNSINPLGIPSNVPTTVRVTQVIAIIIAAVTHEDVRIALNLCYDGYSRQHSSGQSFHEAFPNASQGKWTFAIICRFLSGGLGLTVTFFLIMTAETVIDLLLNFTAMEFVSLLDNVAFFLALEGYIGMSNKVIANRVLHTTYLVAGGKGGRRQRLFFFLAILTSMLVGWGYVFNQQQSGHFLCETVFIQFGDEFLPSLGTFSGLYDSVPDPKGFFGSSRVKYIEMRSGKSQIGYCGALTAWTFTYNDADDNQDPCDWYAKSSVSSSFDLTTTVSSDWHVTNGERTVPIQDFKLSCFDCQLAIQVNQECGGRGSCVDAACECQDGFFGLRCQFPEPCLSLEIDIRKEAFLSTREWSAKYDKLLFRNNETVQVYDRPVYTNEYEQGMFDIIMFTGRRWVLTSSEFIGVDTLDDLSEYLGDFHAHYSDYEVAFISEPVVVDTSGDSATPLGLSWFVAGVKESSQLGIQSVDLNQPSGAILLCGVCDNTTNACLYDGLCTDGVCECSVGSSGTLCQIPPLGNGRCDPFFNTPVFNHDGGDCCDSTCVSSGEYTCGKDETGYVDLGYPFCQQQINTWRPNSIPIDSDIGFARSGSSVALSSDGTILAIGEPGADTVRLFDKDGSEWIPRGRPLEGPPNSGVGMSVALSDGLSNAVTNPSMKPPIVIAIGAPRYNNNAGMVRLYECMTQGCQQAGHDWSGGLDSFGSSLAISKDGKTIAVGTRSIAVSGDAVDIRGAACVIHRPGSSGSSTIPSASPITVGSFCRPVFPYDYNPDYDPWLRLWESKFLIGQYVSLSGSGNVLAIGSLSVGICSRDFIYSADLFTEVYEYRWEDGKWHSQDKPIISRSSNGPFPDFPPEACIISDDAMVLAIAWADVNIYHWNGDAWEDRGRIVYGVYAEGAFVATSVRLSSDGSIVAVGIAVGDEAGSILTFQYNRQLQKYERLWSQIPGGDLSALALPDDGSVLAVGLPLSSRGGRTTVHDFLSPPRCGDGTSLLRLVLTTDGSGSEIKWDLVTRSGELLLGGGPYFDYEFATFVEEVCVATDGCVFLTIYDYSRGIGISPPGGYSIFLDGIEVAAGSNFKGYDRVDIGNCACPDGMSRFGLALTTDTLYADNVIWSLDLDDGSTLLQGGPYDGLDIGRYGFSVYFLKETCFSSSNCATFSITASLDDPTSTSCASTLGGSPITFVALLDGEVILNDRQIDRFCPRSIALGNCPA